MSLDRLFLGIKSTLLLVLVGLICSFTCSASEEGENLSGELDVILNVPPESMQSYVSSFERKYPNVSITIEYYSDYENDIQNRISTGEYGDVLMIPSYMGYDDFPEYFLPLGDTSELAQKYNYLSQSKLHDNSVYGLPSSVYINGIIYNKRIFEEAGITEVPKTTDSFLEDLQLIHDRTSAIPFYTQYNDSWAIQYWEVFPFIEMTGDPEYKFNQFIFDESPFTKGSTHYNTYSLLYEIVHNKLAGDNPIDTNWNDSKILLNTGDIACMVMGSWALNDIKSSGPNPDDVAFMPFPNTINGQQYATLSSDYCYGISKKSTNAELAKAFVNFMLDESGYATDKDCISILKSDPLTESYSNMENVIIASSTLASDSQYKLYKELLNGINLEDTEEIQRIILAADGATNESFDSIMNDWNSRWEAARPAGAYINNEKANSAQLWQYSTELTDKEYKVEFSDSELDYINNTHTVTVGYVDNTVPFIFNDNCTMKGLAPDLLDITSKETGIQFEYVQYSNQAELQRAIINGTVDMMAYAPTERQGIQLSHSYLGNSVMLVYNNNFNRDDITQNSEVLVSGEDYEFLSDDHPKYYANTAEDALNMVFEGNADYTVINYYSASFFVPYYSSNILKTEPLNYYGSVAFGYGTNVDSRLISICNKILYSIPETDIQTLLLQNMEKSNYTLTFKQYLENNPFIAIVLIAIVSALLILAAILITAGTIHSARRKAKEMEKYENLSRLIDEYIFEIDYRTGNMTFDSKSKEKFNLTEKYNLYTLTNQFLITIRNQIRECRRNNQNISEIFDYDNNGVTEHYKLAFSTMQEHNKPIHIIGKIISADNEYNEKEYLRLKSQTDPLTGLYNRTGLGREFNRIVTQNSSSSTAVLIFDLDSFKQVNDSIGHGGGDAALKHLSSVISAYNDENWIASRIGGDEFVVYSYGLSRSKLLERLETIMNKISSVIIYDGRKYKITASCGAVYSDSVIMLEEGISEADKILYKKKNDGKNGYLIKTISDEYSVDNCLNKKTKSI
jgi:diguanylate cyclase (GGDEF)-like protein